MKKNFGWIQASFAAISLVILGCGFFIENTFKKGLIIGLLAVIALILIDISIPAFTGLSGRS